MNDSRRLRKAIPADWLAVLGIGGLLLLAGVSVRGQDSPTEGLVGCWPLAADARDASGRGHDATPHEVRFREVGEGAASRGAAWLDGGSWLEIPGAPEWSRGVRDFSVSAWIHVDPRADETSGDICSQYDPVRRRGFQLTLKSNRGVTFSQANAGHLQFSIDNDRAEDRWIDCGRPGAAVLAFALCVHDGALYAGTCEPGKDQRGRVYRYVPSDSGGNGAWRDCGAPDGANAVTALVVHDGALYAGTGKYRLAGSSLAESENSTLGGHIYRYDGDRGWQDCGALPQCEAIGGLVVFRGRLYASSLYRPAGFFRYDGSGAWTDCGSPARPTDLPGDTPTMRVEALGVFRDALYATSYDGGRVFRYDGEHWSDLGAVGPAGLNTQTYAFAVRRGELHVGTWPSGRVYRLAANGEWLDTGRLGEELEVMGMLVHNGRLIAGTLPLAEIHEYDDETSSWLRRAQLDATPDVRYRRAWAMAEYQGRVFCSTLPSGRIHSWRAGRTAMLDNRLAPGWRHVVGVREGGELRLYVDGHIVARSDRFESADYDLSLDRPLLIGAGANAPFRGGIADVRLYSRALSEQEVGALARSK